MKIFLIGFMGSGKTYCGRKLSEHLHLPFFDLDDLIVKKEKMSINDIMASDGETHFRLVEKNILEDFIQKNDSFVMATGGGTPCFFNSIDLIKKNGIVIWLNTNTEIIVQRLLKDGQARPFVKNLSAEELKGFVEAKKEERTIYYQQAQLIIKETDIDYHQLSNSILHA